MAVATLITSPDEAEGLIRWSILFALGKEDKELTILHTGEIKKEIQAHLDLWSESHEAVPELTIFKLEGRATEKNILSEIHKIDPDLLVLGQNRISLQADDSLLINRKLFDQAVCDSVMIRLGTRRVQECDQVLIPSSGGPHSRVALRLGSRIAKRFEGQITPLFVEHDIGEEDGKAVGLRILNRVIDEAGLEDKDGDHIDRQVVIGNEVGNAIYEAAKRKNYDLILIGASNSFSVKRKLFGAIPAKMLDGDDALAVAVIRRRRPVGQRIKQKLERFLTLKIPQLDRETRVALFDRLQTQSRWSFDFVLLMLLSTAIASLGLVQNSPAVVIGAMLVAPLMTPLLGSGLALVQGNLPLMRTCLKSIFFGFIASLLVGALLGWLAPITALSHELAARGGPNLLDFGIAAFSGVAASYCVARPGLSSALAGVAIAAALVPPVATVGISLALKEYQNSSGAALLFGTNVVAIILSSALTFFIIGIRGQLGARKLWSHRTIMVLLIALGILLVPLSSVLVSSAASQISSDGKERSRLISILETQLTEAGIGYGEIRVTGLSKAEEKTGITFQIEADRAPSSEIVTKIAKLAESETGLKKISIKILTELMSQHKAVDENEPAESTGLDQ